jgi:hypothetical protein
LKGHIVVYETTSGSTPVPFADRLLGRKFQDPVMELIIKNFPLKVSEHPGCHTCVMDVEGMMAVTPEGMAATLLERCLEISG